MSRLAAAALLNLAAHAVREAQGELARDHGITLERFNELSKDFPQVKLDELAREVQR